MIALLSRNIILINQEMIWAHLNSVTSWNCWYALKGNGTELKNFLRSVRDVLSNHGFQVQDILQRRNGREQPRGSGVGGGGDCVTERSSQYSGCFYRLCVCKIFIRAKSLKGKGSFEIFYLFFLLHLFISILHYVFLFLSFQARAQVI